MEQRAADGCSLDVLELRANYLCTYALLSK
jgi:hypothetical protein